MSKVAYSSGVDYVDMDGKPATSGSSTLLFETPRPRWLWPTVIAGGILCLVGVVCIVVAVNMGFSKPQCYSAPSTNSSANKASDVCEFSKEAQRVDLKGLLEEARDKYFEMNPDDVAWQPDVVDMREHVKNRYSPYNPDPKFLKQKTDAALQLLKKVNDKNIDIDALKPREAKALAQMRHFLKHTFGNPYDENYYAGDWMLGPNLFCWMPICNVQYDVNAIAWHLKPVTYDDVQLVIDKIVKHKQAIYQYRKNVALGVQVGMVRTKIDCRAGVDAMKQNYKAMTTSNESRDILEEWFTKSFQSRHFLMQLKDGVDDQWKSKHGGKNITESLQDALVEGIGQPMLDLINYLDGEHMRHCLPSEVASGLSGLPVDHIYTDEVPDLNSSTTKKLPTGEVINGTNTYRLILSYFTTTDISPEEIYAEGQNQLKMFYSEIANLTRQYTRIFNESDAIKAFKKVLNSSDMWHNNGKFPSNESDENAFKKCTSPEKAKLNCPVRWAAVQRWAVFCREVMSFLYPKITDSFYFTGSRNTAPNCPIVMTPHYNPSNGAQFFRKSDAQCSRPTEVGLPFFLKDYGPIFQEWSVTGHEARPGHHTQVQGHVEHFVDNCGGVPQWLDSKTYYTAFTEGWALYSENPVLSDDTDTYANNLLQKYGMLKWQVWRAVRLIVDTGLHARGMRRSEALKMFEDFAWDTSDFAVKEVTRYQSDPGQATAYMLGRLEILKMRRKAEKELGSKFNLKDFHYQVLKQGSAPLDFLIHHINRYIACIKGSLSTEKCQYITGSNNQGGSSARSAIVEEGPPRPPHYHYV